LFNNNNKYGFAESESVIGMLASRVKAGKEAGRAVARSDPSLAIKLLAQG